MVFIWWAVLLLHCKWAIAILLILSTLQITGLFTADGNWPSVALNFWGDPIILNFIVGMLAAVIYEQGFRLAGRNALKKPANAQKPPFALRYRSAVSESIELSWPTQPFYTSGRTGMRSLEVPLLNTALTLVRKSGFSHGWRIRNRLHANDIGLHAGKEKHSIEGVH